MRLFLVSVLFMILMCYHAHARVYTSRVDGVWSDTNTWADCTSIGYTDSYVVVHDVYYDWDNSGGVLSPSNGFSSITVRKNLLITNQTSNVWLKMGGTINVASTGAFLIGSVDAPILCVNSNRETVIIEFRTGNILSTGSSNVMWYGTNRIVNGNTWSFVSGATNGATNFTLSTDLGLQYGDLICLSYRITNSYASYHSVDSYDPVTRNVILSSWSSNNYAASWWSLPITNIVVRDRNTNCGAALLTRSIKLMMSRTPPSTSTMYLNQSGYVFESISFYNSSVNSAVQYQSCGGADYRNCSYVNTMMFFGGNGQLCDNLHFINPVLTFAYSVTYSYVIYSNPQPLTPRTGNVISNGVFFGGGPVVSYWRGMSIYDTTTFGGHLANLCQELYATNCVMYGSAYGAISLYHSKLINCHRITPVGIQYGAFSSGRSCVYINCSDYSPVYSAAADGFLSAPIGCMVIGCTTSNKPLDAGGANNIYVNCSIANIAYAGRSPGGPNKFLGLITTNNLTSSLINTTYDEYLTQEQYMTVGSNILYFSRGGMVTNQWSTVPYLNCPMAMRHLHNFNNTSNTNKYNQDSRWFIDATVRANRPIRYNIWTMRSLTNLTVARASLTQDGIDYVVGDYYPCILASVTNTTDSNVWQQSSIIWQNTNAFDVNVRLWLYSTGPTNSYVYSWAEKLSDTAIDDLH